MNKPCGPALGTYSPASLQQQMRASSLSGDVSQADLVNAISTMQRFSIIQVAESATFASTQAEYAIGMLLAVMVGQNMISAALGLANGLAEALINLKAMFPGTQAGGWILMLTTFEVLPIYIVIFALFQQMLGDPILAAGVVGATLYLAVGLHTGYRITGTKGGSAGRWRVYRLIWVEYGLRGVFGLTTLAAFIAWMFHKNLEESIMKYIRQDLLTVRAITTIISDFFARKALTAVAGTDAMVSAFVQSETWRLKMDPDEAKNHDRAVADLERLADLYKAAPDTEQQEH